MIMLTISTTKLIIFTLLNLKDQLVHLNMFGSSIVPFTIHETLALRENGQISFILEGLQKKKIKILHINDEIVTNESNELFNKHVYKSCNCY